LRFEGRFEGEGGRIRKNGTRFWANVIIDPIRNADGELIGFAKITRDISEKRLRRKRSSRRRRWRRLDS
jgi:PAS domain S-box-containing protein